MGLDQYMYKVAKVAIGDVQVDFKIDEDIYNTEEIMYFRKVSALEGFMADLYKQKGGKSEEFNCCNVVFTIRDVDEIIQRLKDSKLPAVNGFFFGNMDGETYAMLLSDMREVRDEMFSADPKFIFYYTSWW